MFSNLNLKITASTAIATWFIGLVLFFIFGLPMLDGITWLLEKLG